MACPLIAPITGLRTSHGGNRRPAALNVDVSTVPNVSPPPCRSAPEQNAGGVPVSTTARMSSSSSQRRNASSSSGPIARAERVAHVGSVERDRGDLLAHVEQQRLVLVVHASSLGTS